jgi:hypothetical protein
MIVKEVLLVEVEAISILHTLLTHSCNISNNLRILNSTKEEEEEAVQQQEKQRRIDGEKIS